MVPGTQLNEWSLQGKLQAMSLRTASLAACVSIPCIGNHHFLFCFSFLKNVHCCLSKDFSSTSSATTADTVTSRATRNGDAIMKKDLINHEDLAGDRGMIDDIFDETYKEKEGPKPPFRYVWRNIILMSLLHLGAIFSLMLIPSAKIQTLAWGKHILPFVFCHLQTPQLLGGIFLRPTDSGWRRKWRSSAGRS